MKDSRFLPVEKREPVEEYEDSPEENPDKISVIGESEAEELEQPSGKKDHNTLYIAG